MKKSSLFILTLLTITFFLVSCSPDPQKEALAQCLSENGVKMYGAYWCGHCKDQKDLFGKSFDKIVYIECSLPNNAGQTEICKKAEIESYPTWEFTDDEKISSIFSLQELAQKAGCEYKEE